ncbi:hypothetical protein VOLCADRAFT_91166 [Volvox carteri f. nagariensis]|uniref:Uncharacterized protein n=1 Tax=Volvox carteri f. nagariensis TaxID=3068 RepID=D8TWC7_VOLCA|nr:uncharacterized protein VOLCADRAFT_91166 [Volvox carteri f. nagariensis]EFJ48022.1 hypothetical protein VOLCADRAFT_91166 [Volvox carteri f. nagariensis]|eukprot:XP_002950707.1 hypothetical protein VOLCADRAFT_91166 [Volvox carteri f. nagariensis]
MYVVGVEWMERCLATKGKRYPEGMRAGLAAAAGGDVDADHEADGNQNKTKTKTLWEMRVTEMRVKWLQQGGLPTLIAGAVQAADGGDVSERGGMCSWEAVRVGEGCVYIRTLAYFAYF